MFNFLVNGMRQLKAEEQLYLMDAVSYPHIDMKQRSKKHKELYKKAYPENFEQRVIKTTDLELI